MSRAALAHHPGIVAARRAADMRRAALLRLKPAEVAARFGLSETVAAQLISNPRSRARLDVLIEEKLSRAPPEEAPAAIALLATEKGAFERFSLRAGLIIILRRLPQVLTRADVERLKTAAGQDAVSAAFKARNQAPAWPTPWNALPDDQTLADMIGRLGRAGIMLWVIARHGNYAPWLENQAGDVNAAIAELGPVAGRIPAGIDAMIAGLMADMQPAPEPEPETPPAQGGDNE